ncbi:flagellar biosynthesis GTPase FlhF [Bacillus fengqiuensis]|nr:flagellar biosynthesis GTPase FlhF [Bacillus fengqiuensis]
MNSSKGFAVLTAILSLTTISALVVLFFTVQDVKENKKSSQPVSEEASAATQESSSVKKVSTDKESSNAEEPEVNREDGLSVEEFWTLYNFYNERDHYNFKEMEMNDSTDILNLADSQMYITQGISLGYYRYVAEERYGIIYLNGDTYDGFDMDTFYTAFELVGKVVEGEESYFNSNIYNEFKALYKGYETIGEISKWSSKYQNMDLTFRGIMDKPEERDTLEDESDEPDESLTNEETSSESTKDFPNSNAEPELSSEYTQESDDTSSKPSFGSQTEMARQDIEESMDNMTVEQQKEIIRSVLGADFQYDPNADYTQNNWTIMEEEALMLAESLYYEEKGGLSPYD